MIDVVPFASLGRFDNEWLNARYHFSFASYRDPSRMGLGPLVVWNDDTIRAGSGFPHHGHRDMEIITYVRQGAITHEDHLGNKGRTEAGDVQVMSAGKGIIHGEWNREAGPTLLYQIWIMPDRAGLPPRWETRRFPRPDQDGLAVLASGHPEDAGKGALAINQDAALLAATLRPGASALHRFGTGRQGYLVVARGSLSANGVPVGERDGAVVRDERELRLSAGEEAELLLVDLPAGTGDAAH
jgi:quercetin 2,3-dioxygenase